jgi:CRISPR-associated protein Csm3
MKLLEKIVLKGTLIVETGLHVGGIKSSLDIGGLDLPVIKTPQGVPYLPGSSLKGKLRSLLAKKEGSQEVDEDSSTLKKLFGSVSSQKEVSRCIFRDAYLDEEQFARHFDSNKEAIKLETNYTEIKTENTINRLTGTAQNPRTIERVPAGAKFNFEIIFDKYKENDAHKEENHDALLKKLGEAFSLLENDYLGGSGTRGYGKVKIEFDQNTKTLLGL